MGMDIAVSDLGSDHSHMDWSILVLFLAMILACPVTPPPQVPVD